MRIAFVVNQVGNRKPSHATIRLAKTAHNKGHEVWLTEVGSLSCATEGSVHAHARSATSGKYRSLDSFLKNLLSSDANQQVVPLSDFDVVMLRSNPAAEATSRSWSQYVGILFGRLLVAHGVIVLNDPEGLARGLNKIYLQEFPEKVRPETLITRAKYDVINFVKDKGRVVVKPLQGSGGQGVFLLRADDKANINQIVDTLTDSGYVICQEYLPAAEKGDTRLLVLNGSPLKHRGRYAAFRRRRTGGDLRSNVHAGGTVEQAEVNDQMLEVAQIVGPKLKHDGMFFVGLDIVGDKILEVNIFSPGGLGNAHKVTSVEFTGVVIESLEKKVEAKKLYGPHITNLELSVL